MTATHATAQSSLFPIPATAFSRTWALPSPWTFSIPPITAFVERWLAGRAVVVDPFCGRTKIGATHRNDLVPGRGDGFAMQADEYLHQLVSHGVVADAVLLDPPYSPRQIAEHYAEAGLQTSRSATQLSGLVARCRRAVCGLVPVGGLVLSFGWNSNGMGRNAGFHLAELMLVRHGGGHNDTICIAEVRTQTHRARAHELRCAALVDAAMGAR